jgi:GNAT superfamily N-acetyltransferase
MNVSIRKATEQDYEALCALFAEVDALHRAALPQVFSEPDGPSRTREHIADMLANEDGALLVAEMDHGIVGFVHIEVRTARDVPILVPRRYAVIDNVMVTEKSRRSGIGAALVDEAQRWASGKGAGTIELNVWEFNRDAIAFYETLGFDTASRKMWKGIE